MGTEVYINDPGYMTKMAAKLIYMVKTFNNFLLKNQKSYDFESWHAAFGTQALQSLYKDHPMLTYFTARSNLDACAFEWGKIVKKSLNRNN